MNDTGRISKDLIDTCKAKLMRMKEEILNRHRMHRLEYSGIDRSGGDEVDQSVAQIAEDHFLLAQERMLFQLSEVEWALARIQNGEYGICEETEEPIELDRLMAIPYTRLSIEGAEIRESMKRRTSSL